MGKTVIQDLLERSTDLDGVERALSRERVIRRVVTETGESREVVAEAVDANRAMTEEAVLELTDGEPTTLYDGLNRYVSELESNATNEDAQAIVSDLTALLTYPWPDED